MVKSLIFNGQLPGSSLECQECLTPDTLVVIAHAPGQARVRVCLSRLEWFKLLHFGGVLKVIPPEGEAQAGGFPQVRTWREQEAPEEPAPPLADPPF